MTRALAVAINDYLGTGSDLAGCVNDACDWRDALEARGYEVSMLLDSDATKGNIVAAIQEVLAGTAAGETAVVTYSGHGTWLPDGSGDEPDHRTEAWCPYDVADGQLLTDDELHHLFAARPPGAHVVLISDSCHSGTVARFSPLGGDGVGRARYLPPGVALPGATARAERIAPDRLGWSWPVRRRQHEALLLSGCQDFEYSYDASFDGRPNGAFTYVSLRALQELPERASYFAWYQAIRQELPSGAYPQTPNLEGTPEMRAARALAPAKAGCA